MRNYRSMLRYNVLLIGLQGTPQTFTNLQRLFFREFQMILLSEQSRYCLPYSQLPKILRVRFSSLHDFICSSGDLKGYMHVQSPIVLMEIPEMESLLGSYLPIVSKKPVTVVDKFMNL